MFIVPSPPRLTRRSRLEHLLLLALRCTVIGLLAIGFARPLVRGLLPVASVSTPPRQQVILIDTSASMRRPALWPAAQDRVLRLVSAAAPADETAVLAFDREVRTLVSFEQWNSTPPADRLALVRARLGTESPGWAGTRLDTALTAAAGLLDTGDSGRGPRPRQVVVVSDLQEGSRLTAFQPADWPRQVEVVPEIVSPKTPGNAGLQLAGENDDSDRRAPTAIRLRVTNAADSRRDQFQLGWAAKDGRFIGTPIDVHVAPGQNRVISVPLASSDLPADRIVLRGDEQDFDNVAFVVPPEPVRLNLLYFGAEEDSDPRQPYYFLRRAFPATRREAVTIRRHQPGTPITGAQAGQATLLVVTGVLDANDAAALQDAVRRGATLLFAPATEAAAAGLAAILGIDRLPIAEQRPDNYALLGEIDFRHPLMAVFADARFSDFTKIHFWKYRRLDLTGTPYLHNVARFDNGDTAIAAGPVGRGQVVVLASGWQPADSELALSSKFVPLLHSLLELASGAPPTSPRFVVGDRIPLPSAASGAPLSVRVQLPDGTTWEARTGETNFTGTALPGIYTLTTSQSTSRHAVNLDPSESRTAPLPADEFERLGLPIPRSVLDPQQEARRTVHLQNAEIESRQRLWKWFLAGTLTLLLVETWLAGRTARPQPISAATAS